MTERVEGVLRGRFVFWATASAFLVVEGSIRGLNLYLRAPWVDVPSHFLSGAAVTAALLVYVLPQGKRAALSALVGNLLVAQAWEAAEMIDEVITPDPPHLRDVFFWDGFWDVVFAMFGGLAVLWFLQRRAPRPRALVGDASSPLSPGRVPNSRTMGVSPTRPGSDSR